MRGQATAEDRIVERRRRRRIGLVRSVIMAIALVALAIFMALRPRPPEVLSITLTRALDNAYRPIAPTTTFGPQETFFVSVELRGYRPGSDLTARWRYDGQVIVDTELVAEGIGDGYAGFVLHNDNPPWPAGRYTVEILYEGEVLASAEFGVEE